MEIPFIKPILAIIKQCVNREDLAGGILQQSRYKKRPHRDQIFLLADLVSRRSLMNRLAVNLVPLRETQNESVLHKEMI